MDAPTREKDILTLIRNGWTPPAEALEHYRYLLRPFYDAQGWKNLPLATLDVGDCKTIAALIALFGHFGLAIPKAPAEKAEEEPWVTVLRAYVAEHDGFSTEDAARACGHSVIGAVTVVGDKLREWGLNHYESAVKGAIVWHKRQAA